MLKRLYVHNYKCLVNFEINFDQDISLFLGANGSGKSTVFEVLAKLRRVIIGEEKIENIFDETDCPRWQKNEFNDIRFELDIQIENDIYKYVLVTETFGLFVFEASINEESLYRNNEMLIESKDKTTSSKDSKQTPFEGNRSSLNRFQYLNRDFLSYLRNLFIVRINPYEMVSTINKATTEIKPDFSNYGEWFAHLNEKNRKDVAAFENAMRESLSGFDYFRIEQAGQAKVLQVDFENTASKKDIITYYFNELSEGQKALIALYALVYCVPENSLICIDEPENFLALPEIQPWLNELRDKCKERNLQALLISHHPSLINFLASDSGYWFSKQDNHTRIQKITEQANDGLSLAQLIEMGWIYGD